MKRFVTVMIYVVLVAILLLASTRESSVTITTPERDAARLEAMVSTIRSEADLRDVEHLARQYELAYEHSINGATARHFKSLVEPILIEAGERRDAIRAEEDHLNTTRATFNNALCDLDRAWSMELGDAAATRSLIAANKSAIAEHEFNIEAMSTRKEELALAIVEAGYPEDMLTELGNIEVQIEAVRTQIAAIEHENEIIELAYRLQRSEELQPENVELQSENVELQPESEELNSGVNVIIEPIEENIYEEAF